MKQILFSFLLCLGLVQITNGQVKVLLRTGEFINTSPEKNPNNHAADFADCIYDGKYFLWLQFNQLPAEQKKAELLQTGIELYDYLPRNTFIASFPLNYNFSQLAAYNVYAVTKPVQAAKLENNLYNPAAIPWAIATSGNIKVTVSFTGYANTNDFLTALNNWNIGFSVINSKLENMVELEATVNDLQKIASHPLTQFIEPVGAPPVLEDIQAVTDHRTTSVQSSDNWITGKKLDGSGMNIAIGDDGFIGPHIDYQGRLLSNAGNTTAANTHADHCSGIIFGAGNFNPQVRGQATGATLRAYDYYAPYSLFPGIYNGDEHIRVVSHSLGQNCNTGYDANAKTSDQLARTYPSLMYVHSAGNSGTSNCGGLSGWRNITGGYKAGKNVITVANLGKSDAIDATSSRGPLPDGRIKPDIAAVGSSVNSTQPDNTFDIFSGTSMACPAVAGNMAVLYQAYKNVNAGAEPEAALIKAVALNTADDLGNPGPDFIFGWGRINVRKAVSCIENVRYFSGSLTTGITNTHTINIPANVATAKIMVYWHDKDANTSASRSLVNNLDATLTSPSSIVNMPWVLDIGAAPDETTVSNAAVTGVDSINNMEQIQLDAPAAGAYTLKVLGKAIPSGPQKYYVVYEFSYIDEITVTYPFGGESFVPNSSERLRWDAVGSTGTFTVQYSLNNGSTWTNISTSVAGDRRYLDWSPPSTATTMAARIKVSRNSVSDMSDTAFVIIRIPASITFSDICQGTTKISWAAVTGATAYDVCRLGEKYMDVVATTTATNVTLSDVGDTLNYFAVRAKLANTQGNGRRSNAIAHTNTLTATCPVPVKLTSFNALVKNNHVTLDWFVANEENMLNYVVEKSASPAFESIITVGVVKPNNRSAAQQYSLVDKSILVAGNWYYRLKMIDANKALYSQVKLVKVDKTFSDAFAVSPNPATSIINLTSNADIANVVVKLYNGNGQQVYSKNILTAAVGEKHAISANNLPAGYYFVKVINVETAETLYQQKIAVIK